MDHEDTIEKLHLYLTKKIDLVNSDLWSLLITEKVISHQQQSSICELERTNIQQVRGLLSFLQRKPRETFEKFITCLRKCDHKHVADKIQAFENSTDTGIDESTETTHMQHAEKEHTDVLHPKIYFILDDEGEKDPGPNAIINHMQQSLNNLIPSLHTESIQSLDRVFEEGSHIVKLIPHATSNPLNIPDTVSASCLISSTPEDFWSENDSQLAEKCSQTHMSRRFSGANLYLGNSVFIRWKKYMIGGEENVVYYPSPFCPDIALYQTFYGEGLNIMTTVSAEKESAFETLTLVLGVLKDLRRSGNLKLHIVVKKGCPFREELVKEFNKWKEQSAQVSRFSAEVIELRNTNQVKPLMENTVWLLLDQNTQLNWVQMIPVNHAIPHIISSQNKDLYLLYGQLKSDIEPFVLKKNTSKELLEKLSWFFKNQSKAYKSSAKLSENFHTSAMVRRSQRLFLESCLGDFIGFLVVNGYSVVTKQHLAALLDKILAKERCSYQISSEQGEVRKILKSMKRIFKKWIYTRESSVGLGIYIRDHDTLHQLEENIRSGAAAHTMRNVLHLLCLHQGIDPPVITSLELTLHRPPVFCGKKSDVLREVTELPESYQVQGEKLMTAVKAVHIQDIKKYIREGADVNFQDELGRSPLMKAASQGYEAAEAVNILVDAGALVGLTDKDGETALSLAAAAGSSAFGVVEMLLQAEAFESLCTSRDIAAKVKGQLSTVLNYLNEDDSYARWRGFMESLTEGDHKHIAENLEDYLPEAFTVEPALSTNIEEKDCSSETRGSYSSSGASASFITEQQRTAAHISVIQRFQRDFMKYVDLEHSPLLEKLVESGVLYLHTAKNIKKTFSTNTEQVLALTREILGKNAQDFMKFVDCLTDTGHKNIANRLLEAEKQSPNCHSILSKFGADIGDAVDIEHTKLWELSVDAALINAEKVQAIKTVCLSNRDQVAALVAHLLEKNFQDFNNLISSLEDAGYKDMAQKMLKAEEEEIQKVAEGKTDEPPDLIKEEKPPFWKTLTEFRSFLMSSVDMDQSGMWDELIDTGVILQDMVDKIKDEHPTNDGQVGALLWYLKKCGIQEYDKFLHCLSETGHTHVAKTLQNQEPVFSGKATSVDLKRVMGQLSIRKSLELKAKHKQYIPASYHIVFEKAYGPGNMLHFPRYRGSCQAKHQHLRKYEPRLYDIHPEVPESYHFQKVFCQQIERIRSIYSKVDDETFRVLGRIGRVYMRDDPPHGMENMTVEQLDTLSDRSSMTKQLRPVFRSAFKPLPLRHDNLEYYLRSHGYELIESEPRSMVTFQPKRGPPYTIVLDGDDQFIEFRRPSISWLLVDIKRCEEYRRDLRFHVQSILPLEEEDPRAQRFKNTKVLEYIDDRVVVQPEFVEECDSVRRKVTHKFRLPDGATLQDVEEVQLVKAQDNNMKLNMEYLSGPYPWIEEVVLICSFPDLNDTQAVEKFPENFLRFCTDLENASMARF